MTKVYEIIFNDGEEDIFLNKCPIFTTRQAAEDEAKKSNELEGYNVFFVVEKELI